MLEPHAYIPLDPRMLSKKNTSSAVAHFGTVVKGAPGGVFSGAASGGSKYRTQLNRKQRQAKAKNIFLNKKT